MLRHRHRKICALLGKTRLIFAMSAAANDSCFHAQPSYLARQASNAAHSAGYPRGSRARSAMQSRIGSCRSRRCRGNSFARFAVEPCCASLDQPITRKEALIQYCAPPGLVDLPVNRGSACRIYGYRQCHEWTALKSLKWPF